MPPPRRRHSPHRRSEEERADLFAGVMSGTSLDGVDAVLVRLRGGPPRVQWRIVAHQHAPYPSDLRARLLRVAEGEPVGAEEIACLHVALGEMYGAALLELFAAAQVEPAEVEAAGLSGQTIYHRSARESAAGGVTFQIGAAAVTAERAGVRAVSDLRAADVAAGGEGAPLVPYADFLLFRDDREGRIVLNVGGVANLTAIPAGGATEDVIAFDTGPGNLVLDGVVREITGGRETFDDGGARAARGHVLDSLVDSALADPYFAMVPPKSTGRERFGAAYVRRWIEQGHALGASDDDLVASACALTAASVARAVNDFVRPRFEVNSLYVAGGGANNVALVQAIADRMEPIAVETTLALGLPAECREALCFAVLARETLRGRPGNLPQVTGASRRVVLGQVTAEPKGTR
jgi:anhydro-N-acetylmuramic acid kinase